MSTPSHRRGDVREALRRDLQRRGRRSDSGEFWRALALLGGVGWPIALLAAGGAWWGHTLDARWKTGLQFTLLFLLLGVGLGGGMAWRLLRGRT
ncbi:ATPase F0F1 [Cystobacter fuscus]|uniref:AtpZ/AtpI family protein n=1 Tax=Cystobacter fuscus TaxID=43 RepID=UPI002B2B471A|nr:ATPase F0F1 [Cystobacter fuscus]